MKGKYKSVFLGNKQFAYPTLTNHLERAVSWDRTECVSHMNVCVFDSLWKAQSTPLLFDLMRGNVGWQSERRKANESTGQTRDGAREGWRMRWVRGDEK